MINLLEIYALYLAHGILAFIATSLLFMCFFVSVLGSFFVWINVDNWLMDRKLAKNRSSK